MGWVRDVGWCRRPVLLLQVHFPSLMARPSENSEGTPESLYAVVRQNGSGELRDEADQLTRLGRLSVDDATPICDPQRRRERAARTSSTHGSLQATFQVMASVLSPRPAEAEDGYSSRSHPG